MKKADLTALGIEDEELIKQIIILHGKDIETIKTSRDELMTQVETLQGEVKAANDTIAGFKDQDIDSIKASVNEWKTKAEEAEANATKAVTALKFDHAVERALASAKAKNSKAVKALLDFDSLKLSDDGELEGITDQLNSIKEENDFLFESEAPVPRVVSGANNRTITGDATISAARKAAGLTSRMED